MLDDKNLKQQILNEVNDDSIPNFTAAIKQKHLNNKIAKKPWYKKGLTWAIGTPTLLCCMATVAIAAVIVTNNSNNQDQISHNVSLKGKENEIAFGVLSINNLLNFNTLDKENINLIKMARKITSNDLSEKEFINQMNYLNPYMITAEAMIDNSLDLNPQIIKLENQEYSYQMVISLGDDDPLIFLYNEISEQERNLNFAYDVDDEEDEEDDEEESEHDDEIEDEEENDEEEQEYSISGIMKKGEITYYVDGEKELDQIENEYELELNVYDNNDKRNLVLTLEQEFETNGNEKQQSYKYVKYENNEEISTTEFSFQKESEDIEIKVEFFIDGKESQYLIEKANDLKFVIDYSYDDLESEIEVDKKIKMENDLNSKYYSYREKNLNYCVDLLIK